MIGLAVVILLCVAIILNGAVSAKPIGWVVVGLGVLAFLLELLGGGHWR